MSTNKNEDKKVLLKIRNLTKEFKLKTTKFGEKPQILHALNNVSVDVYEGETLGVIGESGCGKSTFGKTLIQLHKATSGSVEYNGTDIFSLKGAELKALKKGHTDGVPGSLFLPGSPYDSCQAGGGADLSPRPYPG